MIIYAACYTDCYKEYSPAVFSLHQTEAGAHWAIAESKKSSFEKQQEYIEWCKKEDFGYSEWTEEKGGGFERWEIREMKVEK